MGVGILLAAAVVAGLIAISERQGAREAATVADAQRLGAEALTEDRPDQALALATTGVALDDSVATRSNLLSALLRSPAILGVLQANGEDLGLIALSPNGGTLAVGDRRGTVIVFDTVTGERIGEYEAQGEVAGGEAFMVAFSPRGDSIAVGVMEPPDWRSGEVHVIDARTLRLRTTISLGSYPGDPEMQYIPLVTYSPDGRTLTVGYSSLAPLFVRRFDARSGSPMGRAVRVGAAPLLSQLHPTSDGRLLYAGPDTTYAIDAETPASCAATRSAPLPRASARTAGRSRSAARTGSVRLLDLVSGRVRRLSGRHDAAVTTEAFSPDGRMLATGGEDGTVIVSDVKQGRAIEDLEGQTGGANDS